MRLALLLAAALLAACTTRPLTEAEIALLAPIHGPTLDTSPIRIAETPGIGAFPITFDARPRVTCRERILPPATMPRITARTGGIVLLERLLISPDLAGLDFAAERDPRLDLAAAMFFVHEMTHVWQWQNRALTGYHPARAFTEQVTIDDPYLFDTEDPAPFLEQGYEVQASLVEEYLCCATLDPEGARTERLRALLLPVLPVAEPEAFRRTVLVPWAEDIDGICS